MLFYISSILINVPAVIITTIIIVVIITITIIIIIILLFFIQILSLNVLFIVERNEAKMSS